MALSLYLAIVIDLFSRQVVGFAMSERMTRQFVEGVIDALRMAWFRRWPTNGLIFHSDPGSQYASGDFQKQLVTFGMKGSMSRKGDCWDNAVTETLLSRLGKVTQPLVMSQVALIRVRLVTIQ